MRYLALLATLALGNLVIIVMLVALATCHLADVKYIDFFDSMVTQAR